MYINELLRRLQMIIQAHYVEKNELLFYGRDTIA